MNERERERAKRIQTAFVSMIGVLVEASDEEHEFIVSHIRFASKSLLANTKLVDASTPRGAKVAAILRAIAGHS